MRKDVAALSSFSCLLFALAMPMSGHAAESADWVAELANVLGDCSGFYEFLAEENRSAGKPATGDQMHEMANGAAMAAAYVLAMEYAANHETPKAIGEFTPYARSRADTNKTRMRALLEQEEGEALKAESERCLKIADIQKDLVQKMRNDSVGRPTP